MEKLFLLFVYIRNQTRRECYRSNLFCDSASKQYFTKRSEPQVLRPILISMPQNTLFILSISKFSKPSNARFFANLQRDLFCLCRCFHFLILSRYLHFPYACIFNVFCDSWIPILANLKRPRGLAKIPFQWRTCFLILKLGPSYIIGANLESSRKYGPIPPRHYPI